MKLKKGHNLHKKESSCLKSSWSKSVKLLIIHYPQLPILVFKDIKDTKQKKTFKEPSKQFITLLIDRTNCYVKLQARAESFILSNPLRITSTSPWLKFIAH